jgi:hypothetical protein
MFVASSLHLEFISSGIAFNLMKINIRSMFQVRFLQTEVPFRPIRSYWLHKKRFTCWVDRSDARESYLGYSSENFIGESKLFVAFRGSEYVSFG